MKYIFTLILAALLFSTPANSSPLAPTTTGLALFRLNLYALRPDNSGYLVDGTLTQYDSAYSNNIDGLDALKLFNPGENIGMVRGSYVLIGEKRHTIQGNDSIFFKMWNMRAITYQLVFVAYNLDQPGRMGLLQDNYLHTSAPLNLNDTTKINFSITSDPASKATDRFRVVFVTTSYSALPLIFTSVKAFEQNNSVNVTWNTANESHVKQYNVEKSSDGHNFITSTVIKANNSAVNAYHWTDVYPNEGNNFYRISSIDIDGKIQYTNTMKVYIRQLNSNIQVYPNPATSDNLKLKMINQPAGVYEITLMNSFGQSLITKSIQHKVGNDIENIDPLLSIPKGIYRLEIRMPSGERKVISVLF
ncbi:T9SS type A sorting domain-containing protein [Ginsengibacter hankyongi]|uniref:T9SS type A sorting domain-containing protein n=1 Tax=Ginsengibacter hankyongi TaxID=2607284 RepID=A0A5J5IBS6_9BACT|nr:T9SS type A sorting domain-containing protein [Ginsengibacter hankyongi]KAA9034335.1 T9SS type A sorting domain-containing protein [Ginsengibacter hankyongi]